MKKTVFFGMLVILLAFGFLGCDNDNINGNGDDHDNDHVATTFTVTFDTDGGTLTQDSVSVISGNSIGNLPAQPSKGLWIFDGWFTEKNSLGMELKLDTIISGNITVYAKWISIFEGTWIQTSGDPGNLIIIFTGSRYLVKTETVNLKQCSIDYTETTLTETVLDNFGNNEFPVGTITVLNYTLVDGVFGNLDNGQVFKKAE